MLAAVTAVIAEGKRPVPFRTRKLSPPAPMVLHSGGCGRVGHRRTSSTGSRAIPNGMALEPVLRSAGNNRARPANRAGANGADPAAESPEGKGNGPTGERPALAEGRGRKAGRRTAGTSEAGRQAGDGKAPRKR